jgi:hypothetical protein
MNIYSEKGDQKESLFCIQELLTRFLRIYDKNSLPIAQIYYRLAIRHLENKDLKEASHYANLRLVIISKVTIADCRYSKPLTRRLWRTPRNSRIPF